MALDEYFPADSGVKFIAEPGRFFMESVFTLLVNIIARKVITEDEQRGAACFHSVKLGFRQSQCVCVLQQFSTQQTAQDRKCGVKTKNSILLFSVNPRSYFT